MVMTKCLAEGVLQDFVPRIKRLFFDNGDFLMFGLYPVVAEIIVNSIPAALGDRMGVEVSQTLLDINDNNAIGMVESFLS